MPRGVVLYQQNDSAVLTWVWMVDGREQGVLFGPPGRENVPRPGEPGRSFSRIRSVRLADGTEQRLGLPRPLSRSRPNEAFVQVGETWVERGRIEHRLTRVEGGAVSMRGDARGMFRQVARKLDDLYGAVLVPFVDTLSDEDGEHGSEAMTSAAVFRDLRAVAGTDYEFFAYSGHGADDGLASAGIRTGGPIAQFADEIRRLVRRDGTVVLYACLTARDGGFAQALSRLLPTMTVWGHTSSAEASRNPDKVRFRNGSRETIADIIGEANVSRWRNLLQNSEDMYAHFPFMSDEELRDVFLVSSAELDVAPPSRRR
ncbi:MAG: hypothetical protein MUF00_16180 [Gemmatimonadaceae bacterium]|jgi:hypothetical protein|nr:hypothetical protein [Gemmatimonadaceae bacterium]